MRIVCPHCDTNYHADYLLGPDAKRGPREKHVVGCVCGESFEVTFSETVKKKSRLERWRTGDSHEVELNVHVRPTED